MLTQYQLKNKLKVLLVASHKAPVVAVQMWVKTGSADEKKGEEGISHFIEHLVFKGTQKFGVGEVAKAVEGSGGELNAYTTFDHTVFHVTMSRDDIEVGLDCIAEMMGFPKFDPVEIDREREVVIEEIKRSFDNPHSIASQQLFSTLFTKHPYGIPVIGYDKNIKKVSPKTLVNYYQRRYVPTNMTLVVAGDFEKSKIKKQIQKYYDGFKAYKLQKIKRSKEPKQQKLRLSYKPTPFQEAALNIAFKVPGADHPDVPGLDVLGFILGQGDSSRLVRRLRLETSLVNGVSAGSYNPLDTGLFAVSVYCKTENLFEIHKVLMEELKTILTEPLEMAELNRARLNLEADEIFSLETVDGLARKVGIFQTLLNDPNYIQRYLKDILALTPADILKVARKYLTPQNLNVTLMLSEKDKNVFSQTQLKKMANEIDANLKSALKQKIQKRTTEKGKVKSLKVSLKISDKSSEIIKHRLENGALVILKQNPEIPIFDIKVGFLGGQRLESPINLGATTLLSNTWTSGSMNYSEQKIASTIEGCAGSLSAFGGRNSIGLTLESLAMYEEKAWDLFSDVLRTPLFPQEAVSREAVLQLDSLRTRSDHPSSVAVQLFMERIFAGHPYALDILGNEKTLSSIRSADISAHWEKMVTSTNAVLVAVGDFDIDHQLKKFEDLTQSLKRGQKNEKQFQVPVLENQKYFQRSEKEQTHIIVGYRGLSLTDPDRYALEILQAILSGQGGRLFLELRDKASLAYTVAPLNMRGIETGYFGVYIGCSPEKGKKAISMIDAEIEKITNTAVSEDELVRAKRYLSGRNHIDLQKNGAQASSILFDELYGIDCLETFRFAEHLRNIRAQDVLRVAQRIFRGPSVTVAVGNEQPW